MDLSRTVVTGGLGFIGSHFVRLLAGEGIRPRIVDVDTYAGDRQRLSGAGTFDILQVDVADPNLVDTLRAAQPSLIVHFAAESHVTRSEADAERFMRTNVIGTRNVLQSAIACEADLVVHISTDEVYGPCGAQPFTEDDKLPGEGAASSAYARSKALADDVALSFSDAVPVVVVRPTNCFGPWQHPEKAIGRWTTRALNGRPIPVWGDGGQIRDWLAVTDVCSAIATLIERGIPGEAYNIGPQRAQRSNLEIATLIARLAGRSESDVFLTAYDRPQHDRRYAVDSSKIRGLGWSETMDLEGALGATVSWYEENQSWWQPLVQDAEALYSDSTPRA